MFQHVGCQLWPDPGIEFNLVGLYRIEDLGVRQIRYGSEDAD